MPTKILNKLSLEFQKYNISRIESGASKKKFYRLKIITIKHLSL